MSDDGYDSMDAERERAWRKANPELASWGDGEADDPEEPPCLEGDGIESHRHEIEWLMSGDSPHPVAGYCSCGDKCTVSYAG